MAYTALYNISDSVAMIKDIFGGILKGVADNSTDLGSIIVLSIFIGLFIVLIQKIGVIARIGQYFKTE
jgi:hypothetical protein